MNSTTAQPLTGLHYRVHISDCFRRFSFRVPLSIGINGCTIALLTITDTLEAYSRPASTR